MPASLSKKHRPKNSSPTRKPNERAIFSPRFSTTDNRQSPKGNHMKRTWHTGATALLLTGSLFLAACGGDDKSEEATPLPSVDSLPVPTFAAGTTMETLQK